MEKRLKKYAIITGASQGIGLATAEKFSQANWQVINIARRNCPLPDAINCNIDLSQANWPQQYAEQLKALITESAVISLIHNAAGYFKDNIYDLVAEKLREMLEVNVVAPLQLNHFLLPNMQAGSSIIYLGSTLSEKAVADAASYIISKHAVVGMMRATCQDLQPGIHTCCICPGFTETEMMKLHQKNNSQLVEGIKKRVKANRLIQPQEIAELIYFCANNAVVNGEVIHANLGQIQQ